MNHNLTQMIIDGSKWWGCDDCGCTFIDSYWWFNGKKSKLEPECSADNLDWERQAEDGDLEWD